MRALAALYALRHDFQYRGRSFFVSPKDLQDGSAILRLEVWANSLLSSLPVRTSHRRRIDAFFRPVGKGGELFGINQVTARVFEKSMRQIEGAQ